MIAVLPKDYSDAIWVHLQKFIFQPYSEDGLLVSVEHSDLEKYQVDNLFLTHLGYSIHDKVSFYLDEKDLRIYDLTNTSIKDAQPGDINYKSQLITALDWDWTFKYGRLLKSVGYKFDEAGDRIVDQPVVQVLFDYFNDPLTPGYVRKREKKIRWFKTDGSLSFTEKKMVKVYVGGKEASEAQRRRKNVVDQLMKDTQDMLVLQGLNPGQSVLQSQLFVETIKQEVADYIQYGYHALLDELEVHPSSMLDAEIQTGVTVRSHFITSLDYWTFEANGGVYKGSAL